jgi:pentose-5-phosphate-3-epimerase
MLCFGVPELTELTSLCAQQGDGSCTINSREENQAMSRYLESAKDNGCNGGITLEPGLVGT